MVKVDVLGLIRDYAGVVLKTDKNEDLTFRAVVTHALGAELSGSEAKARAHALSVKLWNVKEKTDGTAVVDLTPSEAAFLLSAVGQHPRLEPVIFGRVGEMIGEIPTE